MFALKLPGLDFLFLSMRALNLLWRLHAEMRWKSILNMQPIKVKIVLITQK